MSFRALLLVGFAGAAFACGGNVVVDHGNGNGGTGNGNGGTGNTGNTGLGGSTNTGIGGLSPGVGGTTGDVSPVGPTGTGGSTNTGMGQGGSVVASVGAGPDAGLDCQSSACSVSSDGSCSCNGRCNGEPVRVRCGTDPGINCSCFKNGQFVGSCQPNGTPNCEPAQSCCAAFF